MKIWTIVIAYLIITWPSSVFIRKITEKWRPGYLRKRGCTAIGFLVDAKSIFRLSA